MSLPLLVLQQETGALPCVRGEEALLRELRGRAREERMDEYLQAPWLYGAFWETRQRQASSLHEVSYRACFKPALPRFFIERLTRPGDVVFDPFAGRGTTAIEAALLGRVPVSNDVNPLSAILARPRLRPPSPDALAERLEAIDWHRDETPELDLSPFYHPRTLRELVGLRRWLIERAAAGEEDDVDRWIRMVATNRLTGHSPGFFSVYTLPPNQATSIEAQRRINARRGQKPDYRCVPELILRKTRRLLARIDSAAMRRLRAASDRARFLEQDAEQVAPDAPVRLTVTSPPFLDIVDYAQDNWLRCWFNNLNAGDVARRITHLATLEAWRAKMGRVLARLWEVTEPGGFLAFEVGEAKGLALDRAIAEEGVRAGWRLICCVVQSHAFTKTANIWGVANMKKGVNTNRVVVLRRAEGGA